MKLSLSIFENSSMQTENDKTNIAFYQKKIEEIKLEIKNMQPKKIYSLKCNYYSKKFPSINELVQDVMDSGMDPSYMITLNGKSIGEKPMDHMQLW